MFTILKSVSTERTSKPLLLNGLKISKFRSEIQMKIYTVVGLVKNVLVGPEDSLLKTLSPKNFFFKIYFGIFLFIV